MARTVRVHPSLSYFNLISCISACSGFDCKSCWCCCVACVNANGNLKRIRCPGPAFAGHVTNTRTPPANNANGAPGCTPRGTSTSNNCVFSFSCFGGRRCLCFCCCCDAKSLLVPPKVLTFCRKSVVGGGICCCRCCSSPFPFPFPSLLSIILLLSSIGSCCCCGGGAGGGTIRTDIPGRALGGQVTINC